MNDDPGRVTAPVYRVLECVHCQLGLHPVADGVPHDPPREHVLHTAQAQFAFSGPVLRDIGQPQLVGHVRGEVALDEVVVHSRSRPPIPAASLASVCGGEHALL